MKRESRFSKDKRIKEVMNRIFEQNPNGIDSEKFVTEVRNETGTSRGKIFDLIKLFDTTGRIKIERDPKDRRKAIYKPIMQRIKTDRRIYQAKGFIESLKDAIYTERSSRKYPATVTIFISPVSQKERAKAKGLIDGLAETNLQALDQTLELGIERLLKPEQKIAIIWTLEGKK